MRLKGILAISGKPGLYKLVSQGRGTIIIESLADGVCPLPLRAV